MSKTETVSVIIPVYNCEKYLRRCIDSVRAQTYSDLDIILIDDGSTDSSAEICDEYEKQDKRIRVIHQENGGLSVARNTGLDVADSDYYVFLDSDDEMMPVMVETLWHVMHKTGADISQCGTIWISNDEAERIQRTAELNPSDLGNIKVYEGRDRFTILGYYSETWLDWVVQWNKLYRKKIFDNLRYPSGKIHEDEFVIHKELSVADKVAVTDKKLHLYYQHEESITHNKGLRAEYNICEAMFERLTFYNENDYYDYALLAFGQLCYHCRKCLKTSAKLRGAECHEKTRDIFLQGIRYYMNDMKRNSKGRFLISPIRYIGHGTTLRRSINVIVNMVRIRFDLRRLEKGGLL